MRFFFGITSEVLFVSQLDSSAFVKAKINNSGVVALGMSFSSCVAELYLYAFE